MSEIGESKRIEINSYMNALSVILPNEEIDSLRNLFQDFEIQGEVTFYRGFHETDGEITLKYILGYDEADGKVGLLRFTNRGDVIDESPYDGPRRIAELSMTSARVFTGGIWVNEIESLNSIEDRLITMAKYLYQTYQKCLK